ncbi:MAG TPA: hypothetical protein VHL52_00670 [Acidimicrobiia bacterium]|nr:hypothetical protein [Acidimicrobiia bacterium]
MAKRERERVRQERQEAKRLKKETLAAEEESSPDVDEGRLMEEFRLLSERHAAGNVSEMTYETERRRIFDELGIDGDH